MLAPLVFGAHHDDCELTAGGLATLYTWRAGRVCFVSLTNGDAGHQTMGGALLARTRRAEARAAAAAVGAESIVQDNHNGSLMPTLENRAAVIKIIGEFQPDLFLLPRPNDYSDRVQKPYPFQPDVVVDTGSVVGRRVDTLDKLASQMYDWLPWHDGGLETVPAGADEKQAWLEERYEQRLRADAIRFHAALIAKHGQARGVRDRVRGGVRRVRVRLAPDGRGAGAPIPILGNSWTQ